MPSRARRVRNWLIGGVLAVAVVLGAIVGILAYPQPLFAHSRTFDEFTVYADAPVDDAVGPILSDARARIAAMSDARPDESIHVFLCENHSRYKMFARLTRRGSNSLAIGMRAFGNIFVNVPKVRHMAANNPLNIRHCRYEGNLAEVIAHEVAHFNVVDRLGYRRAMRIPVWKAEGYAEYQANLAATRADAAYDLADRVEVLLDDARWADARPIARRLYEWHILVEYLGEYAGYDLAALLDPAVDELGARRQMLAWYEARPNGG